MMDDLELLRLIENNARLSAEEIAVMLGVTADDVEAEIKRLKDDMYKKYSKKAKRFEREKKYK